MKRLILILILIPNVLFAGSMKAIGVKGKESEVNRVIKDEMIASKCGWTPFNNHKVKGFPIATIVNGSIVMENGKIISNQVGEPINFKL